MSVMSILVPFVVLAAGFTTVMVLLFRNLQRLDGEAAEAWRGVQEQRARRHDATARLLDAMDASAEFAQTPKNGVRRALDACVGADGPKEAAEADSALAQAWRTLFAEADMQRMGSLEGARNALGQLHEADESLSVCERLYNNAATMYNNAGVTFPALLVAKRARHAPRPLYRPQRLRGASGRESAADAESLAEKSPRIMNAYMLWAVGMSDTITEQAEGERRQENTV